MKKKIYSLLIIMMTFILAFSFVVSKNNGLKNAEAGSSPVVVKVSASNVGKNLYAEPRSDGKVYLNISYEGTITDDIVVYYHTEDRSAVAEAGDYVAVNSFIRFTPSESKTKTIAITTKSTNPFLTVFTNIRLMTEYATRYFCFKLDKVEGNARLHSTYTVMNCLLSWKYTLETYSYRDGRSDLRAYYYKPYRQELYIRHDEKDLVDETTEFFGPEFKNTNVDTWNNTYVNSGLALVYAGTEFECLDEWNYSHTPVIFWFMAKDCGMGYTDEHNYLDISSEAKNNLIFAIQVEGGHFDRGGCYNTHLDRAATSYIVNGQNPYDFMSYDRYNRPVDCEKIYVNKNFEARSMYLSNVSKEVYMFALPKGYDPRHIAMYAHNLNDVYDRTLIGLKFYSALRDYVNPTVSTRTVKIDNMSKTAKEIYLDSSSYDIDGKLRVSVRFSEPVQIEGLSNQKSTGSIFDCMPLSYLSSVTSNDSATVYLDAKLGTKDIKMYYLSGNMTDTLTFEVDLDDYDLNMFYKSITIKKIVNADKIGDFGTYKSNKGWTFNELSTTSEYSLNSFSFSNLDSLLIDYRTPSIGDNSLTSSFSEIPLTASTQSKTFALKILEFSSGKLNVEVWSEDGKTHYSAQDQNINIDNSKDPEKAVTKNFTISGITDSVSLRITLTSRRGKVFKYIYGNYPFDNFKPLIGSVSGDETSYEFNSGQYRLEKSSNLKLKRYQFELLKPVASYYSVLKEVYVSISKNPNGSNPTNTQIIYTSKRNQLLVGNNYITFEEESDDESSAWAESLGIKQVNVGGTVSNYTVYKVEFDLHWMNSILGLSYDNLYGKYYISFYGLDSAGNISLFTSYKIQRYDNRDVFTSYDEVDSSSQYYDIIGQKVYEYSQFNTKLYVLDEDVNSQGILGIYSLKRGDEVIYEYSQTNTNWADSIKNYFTVTNLGYRGSTSEVNSISLKGLKNGYYEIILSQTNGSKVQQSAEIYSYYLTNNKEDETTNYLRTITDSVIRNRLFFIKTKFTYLEGSLVNTENYKYRDGNGKLKECIYSPVFSTKNSSVSFLKFYEFYDLKLYKLTASEASMLNNGGNLSYIKAENEKTAYEGEWWIRYKSKDFAKNNSTQAGWNFYYYKSEYENPNGTILPNSVSSSLLEAMDSVVEYIISCGEYVDLVSSEYINSETLAPYVHEGQSHLTQDYIEQTKYGSIYSSNVLYLASEFEREDARNEFYASYITVENEKYPLASNMLISISSYTRLYAKSSSEDEFTEITNVAENGKFLKKFTSSKESDYFEIIELDAEGMKKFTVYVDVEAPEFEVNVDNKQTPISVENDGQIHNVTNCVINKFSDVDEMSYIIRCNIAGKMEDVYYKTEIETLGVMLPEGTSVLIIGDRSGNTYSITINVCSTNLEVDVNVDEQGLRVTCNRDKNDILRYEVCCNGVDISTEYKKSVTYKESGKYTVRIMDIYGNSVTILDKEFIRPLPEVEVSYVTKLGADPIVYISEEDAEKQIQELDEQYKDKLLSLKEYNIRKNEIISKRNSCKRYLEISKDINISNRYYLTSVSYISFKLGSEYSFVFEGDDISNTDFTVTKISSKFNVVTLKVIKDWKFTVFYTDYPDVSVEYYCMIEDTPPTIIAKYKAIKYIANEYEENYNYDETEENKYTITPEDEQFIPQSINYSYSVRDNTTLISGSTISSDYIVITASDNTDIGEVVVTLDGKTLDAQPTKNTDGSLTYVFRKQGEYIIKVSDVFGNISTFSFINDYVNYVDCYLDNDSVEIENNSCVYGSNSIVYKTYGNVDLLIKSSVEFNYDDTKVKSQDDFRIYSIIDNKIYLSKYMIIEENGIKSNFKSLNKVIDIDSQFDSQLVIQNLWIKIDGGLKVLNKLGKEVSYADIFAKVDEKGIIYIKVEFVSIEDASSQFVYLQTRVEVDGNIEPTYIEACLSTYTSDIELYCDNTKVQTNKDRDIIRLNGAISIDDSSFNDELIDKIEYSYKKTIDIENYKFLQSNEFDDYIVVYENGKFHIDMLTCSNKNGFYSILITNKCGNKTEYIIDISDEFEVYGMAVYKDGTTNTFSKDYQGLIKSNNKIIINAISENVTFSIFNGFSYDTIGEDDERVSVVLTSTIKMYSLVIISNEVWKGFTVKVKNEFGSEVIIHTMILTIGEIDTTNPLITNITGETIENVYYTKLIPTFRDDIESSIVYITASINNKKIFVFNKLTEDNTVDSLAIDELNEFFKLNGDGLYKITFKDAYGNSFEQNINYRNSSTLEVYRKTRSEIESTIQDMDKINLEGGVWCNSEVDLYFLTDNYTLKVNDEDVNKEEVKIFSIDSINGDASYLKTIYYKDEYGNEYNFTIYLIRKEIELEFASSVKSVMISDVLTTNNDVIVWFDEDATCQYTLDSGKLIDYKVGTYLKRDGKYTFIAEDKSGNLKKISITRDTKCDFKLRESENDVVKGSITTSMVSFSPINEDCHIKEVYCNRELLPTTTYFSRNGFWELIIEDRIGNIEYFNFTMLSAATASLDYTTPYDYVIIEFTFEEITESGRQRTDILNSSYFTKHTEHNSRITINSKVSDNIDGVYSVVMKNINTFETKNFSFTVDTSNPTAQLKGYVEGEITTDTVTFSNVVKGDKIEVCQNGKCVYCEIYDGNIDLPQITAGGKYVITVTNEAGVSKTFTFEKKSIVNSAGSIFIMLIILGLATSLFIGLLLRNRSKVDK